jgi:class 3 adenylate cyclase
MSFIETLERTRALLERNGRVSLRALRLEFALDDEEIETLVAELVDVLQVASLEGKALAWIGPASPDEVTGRAERRPLSVLFCDLVGSTDLASRVDAETLRDLIRAYHECAAEVIARYEGYISQYLGDGLLVYFGYPQAREDDPERAVRTGLALIAALDELNVRLALDGLPALEVRVGIHTGPVVVGEVGGGDKREVHARTVSSSPGISGPAT